MEQVLSFVRSLPHALVLTPSEGGDYPELTWGDAFFYYAPTGEVPQATQPYGTIITKDYPDDSSSALGHGRWRLNIHVGHGPLSEPRYFAPHPVYGRMGWVCVVNPTGDALTASLGLLRTAHDRAAQRAQRRTGQ
ncbi:hypothetical protein BH10ACT7_BH10ACT7_02900 [soil metagenome]